MIDLSVHRKYVERETKYGGELSGPEQRLAKKSE